MKNGSQQISQHEEQQLQEASQPVNPSCGIKIMIGYLYFAQGFILSISATMPYIYPELPDYFTLSLFSLSALPFSFKFVTAPLLEKYSSITYGKRKTWIVVSQFATILTVFLCSFFTDLNQAKNFAIIGFFMYFALSLQDIALDALCLKQLGDPKLMSMIQAGCQSTGIIVGGLVLLKATSLQFALNIGLSEPITNIRVLLICVSVAFLIPTILIHFLFHEITVRTEERSMNTSILKVYSIYRYFCKTDYRYFRTLMFFLFYSQGFNFFAAGYGYELINKGFSRDTMNTIDNIQNIVITCLVFLVGAKANIFGYKKTSMLILLLTLIIGFYLWIFFPTDLPPIIITSAFLGILDQWNFLITTSICADFPQTGATGMLFTGNASGVNFGKNLFIHTAILKKVPWKTMSIIGLAIQVPLIFVFTPKMLDLVETGETKIDIFDDEKEEGPEPQKEIQIIQKG